MKTIFEKFSAYNAGCIEEAVMPLEDQGLVLIRGENHDEGDSNGSGKTTLFELFAHTLAGKTSKGSKRNDLLNLQSPKDYHTQAAFRRDGGSHFLVDQYRKHHNHGTGIQIRIDGSKEDLAPDGYDAAQKKVTEYMGLMWSVFQGQLYLSQKYTHTMLEGKPSEKQAYLSQYFGLESLDAMIVEGKRRLVAIPLPDESQLKDMLNHAQGEIDSLGSIDDIRSSLEEDKGTQSSLHKKTLDVSLRLDKQRKAEEVSEDRNTWEVVLSKWNVEASSTSIKSTISRYRSKQATSQGFLDAISTREYLESELSNLGSLSSRSYDEISSDMEDLAVEIRRIERILPAADKRDDIKAKLASLDECSYDVVAMEAQLATQESRRLRLSKKATVLESEVANFGRIEESCPTCSRPMDAEYRDSILSSKQDKLSSLTKKLSGVDEFIEETRELLDLSAYRTGLEESMVELPDEDPEGLRASLAAKGSERKLLSLAASKIVKSSSLQERISSLALPPEDYETISSRLKKIISRITKLEEARDFFLSSGDTKFDPDEKARLTEALSSYESSMEDVGSSIFSYQEKVTKWETYTEQKDKLEKSLRKYSREKNRHQSLTYVNFTLKELKKIGLRESTELLTQVLPVYLSQLFPQGEIGIRVTDKADGFDLLLEKGGQAIPLSQISGGQAKRVGIAIIFAFAKMGRNTTNLLIADEPFTHLDRKGRDACYEILRDLDMGTILITAHDQDLQSTRKYDQVWTVKMKNHKSRLYLDG